MRSAANKTPLYLDCRKVAASQSPRDAIHPAQPLSRRAFFAAIMRRVARHGRRLPAELFPALRVSGACCNHQVCASICPTAALRAYFNDDGAVTGIVFDAAACIACGDCARACPERALTLVPQGDGEAPSGATELTRWTLRECLDCGHAFADSSSRVVCSPCRKTRELALTDVSRLFGIAGKEAE